MSVSPRLASAYLNSIQLVAIAVLTSALGEPVKIIATSDVAGAVQRRRQATGHAIEARAVRWCRPDRARLIVDLATDQLRSTGVRQAEGGWLHVDADAALSALEAVGSIYLETDDALHARATAAVDKIVSEFNAQLRNGKLRDLNRRYKAYRVARAAQGKSSLNYAGWLVNQRMAIVRQAAAIMADSRSLESQLVG